MNRLRKWTKAEHVELMNKLDETARAIGSMSKALSSQPMMQTLIDHRMSESRVPHLSGAALL